MGLDEEYPVGVVHILRKYMEEWQKGEGNTMFSKMKRGFFPIKNKKCCIIVSVVKAENL